jgi:maleate isomerase
MFGWRKRIGYIAPTVMELVPYEFYAMVPKGIGLVGVTCSIDNWGPAQYEAGLAQVESSAQYLASRGVDYIIHGGAPLVTNREPGFDLELVNKLEAQTGVPATTSIRAGIDSMQSMGLRRITVVTPYPEATNAKVIRFLTHYGFEIAHSVYLDIEFKKMQDVPEQEIYKSCAGFRGFICPLSADMRWRYPRCGRTRYWDTNHPGHRLKLFCGISAPWDTG